MKINLHIERLVLDGLPISASERPRLEEAMATELAHLLGNGELSDEFRAGAALANVRAGAMRVGRESSPEKLGTDIAKAVHQGLGDSGTRQSATVGRRRSEKRSPWPGGNPR